MNKVKRNNIKTAMKQNGVKQKHIAARENVSVPAVNQVVWSVRKTPRVRQAIADAVGIPISELWPESESVKSANE